MRFQLICKALSLVMALLPATLAVDLGFTLLVDPKRDQWGMNPLLNLEQRIGKPADKDFNVFWIVKHKHDSKPQAILDITFNDAKLNAKGRYYQLDLSDVNLSLRLRGKGHFNCKLTATKEKALTESGKRVYPTPYVGDEAWIEFVKFIETAEAGNEHVFAVGSPSASLTSKFRCKRTETDWDHATPSYVVKPTVSQTSGVTEEDTRDSDSEAAGIIPAWKKLGEEQLDELQVMYDQYRNVNAARASSYRLAYLAAKHKYEQKFDVQVEIIPGCNTLYRQIRL